MCGILCVPTRYGVGQRPDFGMQENRRCELTLISDGKVKKLLKGGFSGLLH